MKVEVLSKTEIPMSEMKPYQIGRIVSEVYSGKIVMRTASIDKFEVMNLTDPRGDFCWLEPDPTILVELFPPGTVIQITI